MAKDLDTYLKELQASLTSAGADPALVQDALFDAEEHLRAEMAERYDSEPTTVEEYRTRFAGISEEYGTPEEVAAAYLSGAGARLAAGTAVGTASSTEAGATTGAAQSGTRAMGQSGAQPAGQPVVQTGGQTGGQTGAQPSAWRQVFGVVVDPAVYKALLYMILSLATGIAYFSIVVTGVATSGGMLALIVGIPLFLLVLGLVRAMALGEGRLVELLLGTRMPRRERAELPEAGMLKRAAFWLKDSRTWASMAYMILMLPLGIAYFTIAVAGLSAGFGLIGAPFYYWGQDHEFVWHGVQYTFHMRPWAAPLAVIAGVALLLLWLHVIRWIGRGHAAFAKTMLVRLTR